MLIIPYGICFQQMLSSALFLLGIVLLAVAKKKPQTTQDVHVLPEHVPEDCSQFADIGDEVTVHYTGALENGQIFDSSRQGSNRGPLPFVLGEGKVIPGWEQGIKGMCVGERRRLIIPSHLAYGSAGYPPAIPPDATLIFETELMSLKKPSVAIDETIFKVVRFLFFPAIIIYGAYYIYQKYQNAPTKKELKGSNSSKKTASSRKNSGKKKQ